MSYALFQTGLIVIHKKTIECADTVLDVTQSDLHVLVLYLCLETFIRHKQYSAAAWDPALNLCCVF